MVYVSVVFICNVCLSYYFEVSNKIFYSFMVGVFVVMSDYFEKCMIVENYNVGVFFDEIDFKNIVCVMFELLVDEVVYCMM